ncbi:LPXTG cell wall anchor domain-containing protein [Candidatus Enterococcus testudinis]
MEPTRNDDTKESGFLPKTGEITNVFLVILGLLLVGTGVKYFKKNTES